MTTYLMILKNYFYFKHYSGNMSVFEKYFLKIRFVVPIVEINGG